MMSNKPFYLHTDQHSWYDKAGNEITVRNFKKEVKTVSDVCEFIFTDENELNLNPNLWDIRHGGQLAWTIPEFVAWLDLASEGDVMEISLLEFAHCKPTTKSYKGGLVVNKLTREFTGE